MTTQSVPIPCTEICRLDADGACRCGRHIDEISRWSNMDAEERQCVIDRLRRRRPHDTAATAALWRRR